VTLDMGHLYETTHPQLCAYFGARLSPSQKHMAEDLASDVFERALRSVDTFEDRGVQPQAWVWTIARNLMIDHARAARRRAADSLDALDSPPPDALGERGYRNVEDRAVVRPLLDALTTEQRAAIVGRFWYGYQGGELARLIGTTHNGVKKRYIRALAQMQKALTGEAA
jgi:RNA polymerase sigma-70 factor (ECF subfamily)